MSDEPTNGIIYAELKGFRELVEQKFNENQKVHEDMLVHQKFTNGKVAKHEKFIVQAKVWIWPLIILIPVVIDKVFNKLWP